MTTAAACPPPSCPDGIPEHIATAIPDLIGRLPQEYGLCHADLHPDNVIMTADGPRIIDWLAAVRAPAALDLARCHVTLSDLVYAPEGTDPSRPRALNAAVQSEYARLAGVSLAALTVAVGTVAVGTYLPILRAFALAERATNPARRGRMIQQVEATLRSKN
jgi:Ser/Thr protein kinase RdoA (MazF antagonist)